MSVWFVYTAGGNMFFQPNDDVGFVFIPHMGLSMAEIPEQWVAAAERKQCGCCGSERPCFRKASEAEILKWKSG